MIEITFHCVTCDDINKARLGEEGFELLQTEYEALSEIFLHMLDYRDHYVIQIVESSADLR